MPGLAGLGVENLLLEAGADGGQELGGIILAYEVNNVGIVSVIFAEIEEVELGGGEIVTVYADGGGSVIEEVGIEHRDNDYRQHKKNCNADADYFISPVLLGKACLLLGSRAGCRRCGAAFFVL